MKLFKTLKYATEYLDATPFLNLASALPEISQLDYIGVTIAEKKI